MKKKAAEKIDEDWMSTYGDMVTLLLCFFVMMLAASTPDAAKKSTNARASLPILPMPYFPGSDDKCKSIPFSFLAFITSTFFHYSTLSFF